MIYIPVFCDVDDAGADSYVDCRRVNDISTTRLFVSITDPEGDDCGDFYYISDIGKKHFFSKEAAEQALKERELG